MLQLLTPHSALWEWNLQRGWAWLVWLFVQVSGVSLVGGALGARSPGSAVWVGVGMRLGREQGPGHRGWEYSSHGGKDNGSGNGRSGHQRGGRRLGRGDEENQENGLCKGQGQFHWVVLGQ